jgi:hypothetical protein
MVVGVGWGALLVLWLVGALVALPSFHLALGPFPIYDWVDEVEPGVRGTLAATMGVAWFILAAATGAVRLAWLWVRQRHARAQPS